MGQPEGTGGASTAGKGTRARRTERHLTTKPLPDVTPGSDLFRRIPLPGYGVEVDGPFYTLSLGDGLREELVAEGRRHDLSLSGLIVQALELVAAKGLGPLLSAPRRDASV